MPENWSWERGNYWHADASGGDAALDAKYTKELAMLKLKNDALRWCCRWSSSVNISSLTVKEATTASGVDNVSPRLADTAERDYFTSERLIIMQKQLEGTQKYINEQ